MNVLLAASNPFEAVSAYLNRTGPRVDVRYLLTICSILAAIALVLLVLERFRLWRESRAQTPRSLFAELCALHHLTGRERRVLLQAAAVLPSGRECRVFVDPQYLKRLQAAEAERLSKKLFGT